MNTRIVPGRRPVGWVDASCFAVESCAEPDCGAEHVLLQSLYLSTDPYAVCGMISAYNETDDAGIRGLQAVLVKRITMTGFIVCDHVHELPAYQQRVAPWLRSGALQFHEDIVDGIENAPAALIGMMRGEAIGKRLVRVTAE